MKTRFLSAFALLLLTWLSGAPPALALGMERPSLISYVDANNNRRIDVFVTGANSHLYSRSFDGSSWSWIYHGVPPGAVYLRDPTAVTYIDASGNRRIYVFAIDIHGQLVIRYHKGPGSSWQWSTFGGPDLGLSKLAATTFQDDSGVQQIIAYAYRTTETDPGYHLTSLRWNGSSWSWLDLPTVPGIPAIAASFITATNYIGNDGRRRVDVFTAVGEDRVLVRHSLVDNVYSVTNLNGMARDYAATVNYLDIVGNRRVHTFVYHPEYETIWERSGCCWTEIGIAPGMMGAVPNGLNATAFRDLVGYQRINVYMEWGRRVFLRQYQNLSWQPWVDLGLPAGAPDGLFGTRALTYFDAQLGIYRHMVAAVTLTTSRRLVMATGAGSSWTWTDHGTP
jgi:hypothetical protein